MEHCGLDDATEERDTMHKECQTSRMAVGVRLDVAEVVALGVGIVWCVQMLADVAIRPLWNALIPVRNQTTNMSPGVIQWKLLQIQVNHERSRVCTIT